MSGMSVTGKIAVQKLSKNGFDIDVFPSELAAGLQLLRSHVIWAENTANECDSTLILVTEMLSKIKAEK